MKRKLLSFILVFAMIITVFSGCGAKEKNESETANQGDNSTTNAPTAVPDDSTAANSSTEADDKSTAEEEKPEYSEITVEIFDRGTDGGKTDPTNNYYTDWIKTKCLEELNLGVTFVAVSRWEETEQLNNLMAAGTAPDVCLTYSGDLITNYRDLGGLTDLAPYVDTLLTDLKEFLGPDLAIDGKDFINA